MKAVYLIFEVVFLIILILFLVSRSSEIDQEKKLQRTYPINYDVTIQEVGNNEGLNQKKTIESVLYEKDGIKGTYPKFISGVSASDNENVAEWNKLILNDFEQILKIYSFRPFPEISPVPSANVPTLLTITYSMKANDDKRASILYTADYNSLYSAHPSSLVYTTNIDKEKNKRVRLTDYVTINEEFVRDFRTWTLNTNITEPEIIQAINDYMKGITDEELLAGFLVADQIGSDNAWGIYSYTTPDKLGISIQAPNYVGDHVEFERPLSELKNFLKHND